jgi:mRNA interferase RelE/StbE
VDKYKLFIKPSARKELLNLPKETINRVQIIFKRLHQQPRFQESKKLAGFPNLYRVRCGNYRVLYEINDAENIVRILAIKHRKEAYK